MDRLAYDYAIIDRRAASTPGKRIAMTASAAMGSIAAANPLCWGDIARLIDRSPPRPAPSNDAGRADPPANQRRCAR